jgi:hypothetical protein
MLVKNGGPFLVKTDIRSPAPWRLIESNGFSELGLCFVEFALLRKKITNHVVCKSITAIEPNRFAQLRECFISVSFKRESAA